MKLLRKDNGITLISLVITLIIVILLAAASLSGAFGNGNIIAKTEEAIYKGDIKDLKDLWESKIADIDASNMSFDSLEEAIGEEQIPREYRGIFAVENGKLVYLNGSVEKEKEEWMTDVGIQKMYKNLIDIDVYASVKSVIQTEVIKTKPVDIILVLDASGSMDSKTSGTLRYESMIKAINKLMKTVLDANEANRVGIVQFASKPKILLNLAHYTIPDGQDYITKGSKKGTFNSKLSPKKVADYAVSGNTGLQAGVGMAEKMFYDRNDNVERLDYMVLLTDGEVNIAKKNLKYSVIPTFKDSTIGTSVINNKDAAYYTVQFINTIRGEHPELKFYTINYATSALSKVTLNPTDENCDAVSKTNASIKNLKALDNYVTDAFVGEFDEKKLADIFQQIAESILEDQIVETKIDTVSKASTLVVDESMRYKDLENNQEVIFKLDTTGEVKVTVDVGVFKPTGKFDEKGHEIRELDTSRATQYEKKYTVTDIINGADPNLMISGGSVIWNISNDFNNQEDASTDTVRAQAILKAKSAGFTYDESAGEAIDIGKVKIAIPVYQDSVIPLG